MARFNRQFFAGKFVAQEARKDARAGDHLYANTESERFKRSTPDAATRKDADEVASPEKPKPHTLRSRIEVGSREKPTTSGTLYALVALCKAHGLPEPTPEYQFHATRRWRFDYAWPLRMVALEVEGGIWTQGRHTRGSGALADLEKYSEAAILGWRVIYCTPDDLMTLGFDRARRALAMTRRAA